MARTIFVINPNSTSSVTQAFDQALDCLRVSGGANIVSLTLDEGPAGIQTQMDVERVTLPLTRLVQKLDAEYGDDAAAYVIACFSDPGVHAVREVTRKPVLGISECGMMTAMTLGQQVGVIAILRQSIPRHTRFFAASGFTSRLAGERPIGMNVTDLSDATLTRERLLDVGRQLRDDDQADVIVLGCAGMAAHREWLQQSLNIPVVEPTQAAVGMALARVLLAWHHA